MAMLPLRSQIKILLIASLWGIFAWGYFSRFPLPGFAFNLYLLLLSSIVSGSAGGFGSWAVARCPAGTLTIAETILFSMVTGFGIISLLMILAGVIGLWTPAGAVTIVVAGLLLLWRRLKISPRPSRMEDAGFGSMAAAPLFLVSLAALASLLIAFAPPTYYDTLVYHFALPQAYIQAKHWIGQTDLIYSAFPQTLEMIWTLGILLAGDVLANLLGWILACLGVMAVYLFAKRYFGQGTASWAAALLSIMPAYVLLSSGGYIDVGLALFSFMSFYALCLWKPDRQKELLVLAGALAGWAMGTKYTGAIPFILGGVMVGMRKGNARFTNGLLYAGAALLVFSPWLLKNLYYVGNPVFPFLYSLNIGDLNPWLKEAAKGYFLGLAEYVPRSGGDLFKLLWDIAVNGFQFGGGMDVLGDLGWAPLFAFLPALWLVKKKSSLLGSLLLYLGGFYIAWAMNRPVLRFLLPLAPFLAVAAAYGYDQGVCMQRKGFRILGKIFLVALVASNIQLFFETTDVLSLFSVPMGFESRDRYLSRKLVNNYYPAAVFMNETLPDNSLTYVVGDQRGYYYNKPVLVTPVFNSNPLTGWANGASSADDLIAQLKARHVTTLLINHSEFKRLDQAYHLFPFTAKGQANWDKLRSKARLLYRDVHCDVLSLAS